MFGNRIKSKIKEFLKLETVLKITLSPSLMGTTPQEGPRMLLTSSLVPAYFVRDSDKAGRP